MKPQLNVRQITGFRELLEQLLRRQVEKKLADKKRVKPDESDK